MSGSLPTSPALLNVNIKHNSPSIITFAVSGRRQVKTSSAQYFSFTCQYPPMKRNDAQVIYAFLTAQKGQFETFTMTLPEYSDTNTGYSGATPSVTADFAAGISAVTFDGAQANTALVKAGDFIKFSGHTKVYMVIADVTTNGSGAGTVNFTPHLQQNVLNNQTIAVNNVPFTVFLEDEQQEYKTGLADIVRIEFGVREALG